MVCLLLSKGSKQAMKKKLVTVNASYVYLSQQILKMIFFVVVCLKHISSLAFCNPRSVLLEGQTGGNMVLSPACKIALILVGCFFSLRC